MLKGAIIGTVLAFGVWYFAYKAARPAIARSIGQYVKDHAAEQIPNELQPIALALGAQISDVANLLGNAVEAGFLQSAP